MKAQIYINRHVIAANKKTSKDTGNIVDEAAIAIHTYLGSIYAKTVDFTEQAKLIQDVTNARCSGATIWIEVEDFESLVIDGIPAHRGMLKKQRKPKEIRELG